MGILDDFEPVTTTDGRKAISIDPHDVSTLAVFMTHYWEAELTRPIFTDAPPRLGFTFAGQKWLSDIVTPLTTQGFLIAAYREMTGATGVCFALERTTTNPWQLVKHFTWLHGGVGELDSLSPSEACRLFVELEIGRRLPR